MKTLSVCTLGCRVNQYESRALTEIFVSQGYTVVPFGEKCDVCIINTCAVTAESERKSAQMIRRAKKLASDVRVCGCFAQKRGSLDGINRITGCLNKGILQDFTSIPNTESGYELLDIGGISAEKLPNVSSTRAFVKIQDGCNGKCTYCIIPKLRGRVRSRPAADVLAEIKRLADGGYKEVILTGIETAAYNCIPLWELIELSAKTEGIQRLRLGSLDPMILNDRFIASAARTEKLMPHFHISLQSGCSRILKLMGRPYTAEEARDRINALKAAVPNVMLSADIICSFPTESFDELRQTAEYLKEIGFLHIHAFSYSKRPGTPAADMDGQIPEDEKRRRMKYFLNACEEMTLSALSEKVGQRVKVLIEQEHDLQAVGHTEDFCEAVIEESRPLPVGSIVECCVNGVKGGKLVCTQI